MQTSIPLPAVTLPPGCNFIAGQWRDDTAAPRIPVVDPASEEVIGDIPCSTAATVDQAVQAARQAFENPLWRDLPLAARERLLHRLADLLEQDTANIAAIESLDNGKPVTIASTLDVPMAVAWLRYYAGWPTKLGGQTLAVAIHGPQYQAYSLRQPVGVVGLIVPWNYPLVLAIWKLAPALAAGNTIVLKPSEHTPYSVLRLAQLAQQAGLPDGVLNIVLGDGKTGQALVDHPGVNKISFTGSTAVGKRIVASVAHDLKRLTLELGGKSPTLILPDADLNIAIPGAAQAVFINSGQICFAGTRLLAPRKMLDQVLSGIAEVAASFKMGPGLQADTMLGPLISERQAGSVMDKLATGVKAGAAIFSGGARLERPGFFVEPTIMVTEDRHNPLFRDELFGPVLTAMPYDDIEELAGLANDSDYGLGAHVYTRDLANAHRLANKLQAGTVWINCQLTPDPGLPFGGFKQSGWGRENGEEVFAHYTESKTVMIKTH